MPQEKMTNIPTSKVPEKVQLALESKPDTKKIEVTSEKTYAQLEQQTWTITRYY
jgi:hypothetical protein